MNSSSNGPQLEDEKKKAIEKNANFEGNGCNPWLISF